MKNIADLEISLKRLRGEQVGEYIIETRFSEPSSDVDIRTGASQAMIASLSLEDLRACSGDPVAYAGALTDALFADAGFRAEFARIRAVVQRGQLSLRLRLLIAFDAIELHALRWELLLDPDQRKPLFTGEEIFFSRFLVSRDGRPVQLRSKTELRALVAVANPSNLGEYSLAEVDVAGETQRARAALGAMQVAVLPGEAGEHCTLNRLIERLREGPAPGQGYDVLYLVAHGAYRREEPLLWLEDDQGKGSRVSGAELAQRIGELKNIPRLIVLASCQSAGDADGAVLNALGPRLADCGVPAILAMQGNISMETVNRFMPVFFRELVQDGQIDRALAVARGMVRDRGDYWIPVLYMRLKSGRLWYTPGVGDSGAFEKWASLCNSLYEGKFTPIIGSGLMDNVYGSVCEIAERWADQYKYPFESHEREDLPRVAQFLAIQQDDFSFPYKEFSRFLRSELVRRYGPQLPEAMKRPFPPPNLNQMLAAVTEIRAGQGFPDPHRKLAALRLPIYITTSANNLLELALKAEGADPVIDICPWNEDLAQTLAMEERDPNYQPDPDRPLVYHLFGRFDVEGSLVLTEDDYFDFLIGISANQKLIPPAVLSALTSTSLLFIGFKLDDWDFRVFYRFAYKNIASQLLPPKRRGGFTRVGVQLDQEDAAILDPLRARRYLEAYFQDPSVNIALYWGSAEDFLTELTRQLSAMG